MLDALLRGFSWGVSELGVGLPKGLGTWRDYVVPQLFLIVGESRHATVQHIQKKWLPPMQTTAQATKCNKYVAYVLPQHSNHTTSVIPNGNKLVFTTKGLLSHSHVYIKMMLLTSSKGCLGCGRPSHVPNPWPSSLGMGYCGRHPPYCPVGASWLPFPTYFPILAY